MRSVRFSRDVPTRWNSTYKLLCQSDEYKELLCDFIRYNISSIILHPNQLNICTKIYQLFKVFNDATNTLFGVYYPTTNLFMIEALNIIGALYDCMCQEEELKPCILVMKAKWCDYYASIPIIYLLELIFDPCCKLDMMVTCLENYYSFLDLML